MTNEERDLNHFIIDNVKSKEITNYLFTISRHERRLSILRYLVKNKITGQKFINEIAFAHKGSILNFISWIIMKIDTDISKRPILIGRDWN